MILKCKKIRNVDKSVCVAEQKIAYNYAFSYVDIGKSVFNADAPEFAKDDGYFQIEAMLLKDLKANTHNDFNIDAVIIAFRQGFREYCNKSFIATSYEQISNCFKIPYTIQ